MLQGLEVDENPLLNSIHEDEELEIVYEDEWLVVVNKPAGMLSVPGKEEDRDSVLSSPEKEVSRCYRTYDCTSPRYGDFRIIARS